MTVQEGEIGDKEFYFITAECESIYGSDEQLTIAYHPGDSTEDERGLEGYYAFSTSTATGPGQTVIVETQDMPEFIRDLLELHEIATAVRAALLVEESAGETEVLSAEIERLNERVAELEAQLGEGEEE